jgi:hypothetical protein
MYSVQPEYKGILDKLIFTMNKVENLCKYNLYKPNTCLFHTQKLVTRMVGLDRFHCICSLILVFDIEYTKKNVCYIRYELFL